MKKYTDNKYLQDISEYAEPVDYIFPVLFAKFKYLYSKLLDVDYYFYTIRILQNLPMAFLIIYLGFLSVFNLLKYTESSQGNKIYPIVTSSMAPEIAPGSLIYSSPAKTYSKGDIVSYTEKTNYGIATGKTFTHRIIEINTDGTYVVKGDANSDPDPFEINKSQIQGKVIKVIPFFGYFEIMIKTVPGFLVLVASPAIFLLLSQIKELKFFSREY